MRHTATPPHSRRVFLHAAAAVVVAFAWVDWLVAPGTFVAALMVRLATAACVLLIARLVGTGLDRLAILLAGACAVAMAAALTMLQGGSSSPLFAWLVVIPLLYPAVLVEDRRLVMAISALCAGAVFAVLHAEDRPFELIAGWMGSALAASTFAVLVAHRVGRLHEAQAAAQRAHAEARARLEESERRREVSEHLAGMGRIAAGVAHEINNPLAYVKGNIELVQSQVQGSAAAMLADALLGVERIQQIVADMRGMSRLEPEPLEPLPVGAIVGRVLHVAGPRLASVRMELDLPEGVEVLAGRGRMEQVMLNLLVNAADALRESCRGPEPVVRVAARNGGDRVTITVEDNGPGLTRVQGHLFEPFFTTKPPGRGTGLGLPLSREYVESFGGALTAAASAEGGARFVIELPAARAELVRIAG